MNKNYTLKELADMFASVRREALSNGQSIEGARELALKHILDAIDYQLTKDEEREAFAKWWVTSDLQTFCNSDDAFKAWKAGREELRRAINKPSYSTPEQTEKAIQELTPTEPAWILDKQPVVPAWIPWYGGDKSPIVGEQTRYEVECRSGARNIWNTNFLRWSHDGSLGDIMAYRILD
jgi:hypothetical protein